MSRGTLGEPLHLPEPSFLIRSIEIMRQLPGCPGKSRDTPGVVRDLQELRHSAALC